MAYNNISVLRQQMKPTWRVHAWVTSGGAKPNTLSFSKWSTTYKQGKVKDLYSKAMACYEVAAKATGCTVEVTETTPFYEDVVANFIWLIYESNAGNLGVVFEKTDVPRGSTDMGNVSYVVPSIHSMYKIGDGTRRNHTREFTAITNTPEAHQNMLTAAKAMSMTVVDVLTNPIVLEQSKKEFTRV